MFLVSEGYSLLMSGWIAGLGFKVHWVSLPILPLQGWVVQSWGFRSESFKRKFILVIFVHNLMIRCSEKNRENYLKEAFKQKEWRNQVTIVLMNYQESLMTCWGGEGGE